MARGQKHQRNDPPRGAQRVGEIGRAGEHWRAILVLQLNPGLVSVAGQVQHVVVVLGQRGGDRGGVGHFQDAHLGALIAHRRRHRVEDRAHLVFDIQPGLRGLVLIRRPDREQDLQRPRGWWHPIRGLANQAAA